MRKLIIEDFEEKKQPLVKAIIQAGSRIRFAKLVGVSRQFVDIWLRKDSKGPPLKHCIKIEKITFGQVTRSQLRPDIFGEEESYSDSLTQKVSRGIVVLNDILYELNNASEIQENTPPKMGVI
jgi:DNA-binding transcriptional regulator YdaS (Cro superfamily)